MQVPAASEKLELVYQPSVSQAEFEDNLLINNIYDIYNFLDIRFKFFYYISVEVRRLRLRRTDTFTIPIRVPAPHFWGLKKLWITMPDGSVNFVKKSQVLMCQFEDCWDREKSKIIQDHEIIENIKPEIGKIRPVVIVYPHKRTKLAVVIPLLPEGHIRKMPMLCIF